PLSPVLSSPCHLHRRAGRRQPPEFLASRVASAPGVAWRAGRRQPPELFRRRSYAENPRIRESISGSAWDCQRSCSSSSSIRANLLQPLVDLLLAFGELGEGRGTNLDGTPSARVAEEGAGASAKR